MARCTAVRRNKVKICSGALSELISLQTRTIEPPSMGSVDFTEVFTTLTDIPAMIETKKGVMVFNGINTVQTNTVDFTIRFIAGITFENWVEYKGNKYKILSVDNIDLRDEWYRIHCDLTGDATLVASFT